jgi:polysaccharide deacetylase 2 family uncharacterized protein YibQ
MIVLFSIGLGCLLTAAAMWLLTPDSGPPVAVASSRPTRTVTPPAETADTAASPAPPEHAVTPSRPLAAATAPSTPDEETAAGAEAVPSAAPEASEPSEAPEILRSEPPVHGTDGRPRLAIIIDDCGQWPTTEKGFVALPFPVTLSVLPHVRYGPAIAREAEAAGKGVMLHLPMQTISGRYPGPGTITVSMDDSAIRNEVADDLAELPEARGVNNHEGSRATADRRVMGDVADVLVRENRFWIDSRTSAASVAADVTRARGIPSASRDVFLDDVDSVGAVETQLRQAAAQARSSGTAIAIGHPRAATLLAVRTLGPELEAGGIDLTLASDLVR